MPIVLGIDAAWTPDGSSGIALLRSENGKREILAAHDSYDAFIGAHGTGKGSYRLPDVEAILKAAYDRAGTAVSVVAIDMPLSRNAITRRREADNAISREFGGRWASTHSPNTERPGIHGKRIQDAFEAAGFVLVTGLDEPRPIRCLIECYPLAALVNLLNADKRPAYKSGKRYKHASASNDRITDLLVEWEKIRSALATEIAELPFVVRKRADVSFRTSLKGQEDTLDAIICAWVGARFAESTATPYGDEDAAIWVPHVR